MGLRASEDIKSQRAAARLTQPIDPVGFRMAATPTSVDNRNAYSVILNQQQPSSQGKETARVDGLRD